MRPYNVGAVRGLSVFPFRNECFSFCRVVILGVKQSVLRAVINTIVLKQYSPVVGNGMHTYS